MPSCVIDTSAVFVDLQGERGAEEARRWLKEAAISTVNLQEIASKAIDKGGPREKVSQLIERLRLETHNLTADLALAAGLLRIATARKSLSLGDRSCLALARQLGVPAVTADRDRADVADATGVEVVLVR